MITKRCIYNGPSAKAGYNPSHEERVNLIIDQANAINIDLRKYRGVMMMSKPEGLDFSVEFDKGDKIVKRTWILKTSYKTFTTKEDATL